MSQTITMDIMTMAQELGVRFRHLMFTTTKTVPATLKASKDGHSARVVQPRFKKQVAHVTVAYRLDMNTNILTLAFSICHPDDQFIRYEGKYNAFLRYQREESVEIVNMDHQTVHIDILNYIYGAVFPADSIWPKYYVGVKRDHVSLEVKSSLRRWAQW